MAKINSDIIEIPEEAMDEARKSVGDNTAVKGTHTRNSHTTVDDEENDIDEETAGDELDGDELDENKASKKGMTGKHKMTKADAAVKSDEATKFDEAMKSDGTMKSDSIAGNDTAAGNGTTSKAKRNSEDEPDSKADRNSKADKNKRGNAMTEGRTPSRRSTAAKEEADEEAEDENTLKMLKDKVSDDDTMPLSAMTLRKILGGDILTANLVRQQIWLYLLIMMFLVIYVAFRYQCQQDMITIDKLETELKDAKYRALSSNSTLTEKCRESHILERLKNDNDSLLHISDQPPYIINVPEDGE